MTREEAAQALYAVKDELIERHFEFKGHVSAPITAIDMAIEVLKAKTDGDIISRQDAIDAIMGEPTDAHYPSWYAQRIKLLPSAKPEIIACGEGELSAEPKTAKWILDQNGMDWNYIHTMGPSKSRL